MRHIKSISIGLAQWSLQNKKYRELYLLIHIKKNSSGVFHKSCLDNIFKSSEIKTKKTFYKRLHNLIDLGLIAYNEKTGWYKVLSFKRITRLLDCTTKEAVIISPDINLANFQSFLFASIKTNAIRKSKYFYTRHKDGQRIARDTGVSTAFEFFDPDLRKRRRYFTISMSKMANKLGISRQRANKLKLQADKNRFIECFEHRVYLGVVSSQACRHKHLMDYKWYVEFEKSKDKKIRAYRIMPDEVLSNLQIKRKMFF